MLNKVVYQGRFTADPELRSTQSGISFMEFTLAWSVTYKDVETKCFLRCKAWRSTAEFISKYFTKGKEILVEGSLETNEWTDEQGQKKSRTILNVEKVHFCGGKQSNGAVSENKSPSSTSLEIEDDDDDLPI